MIDLGNRQVVVERPGRGHTDADLVVLATGMAGERSVVFTGDLLEESGDPAIDADSDVADVEACREAGMNWFVAKPIDPAKLVQTVVDALDQAERDAAERAVA